VNFLVRVSVRNLSVTRILGAVVLSLVPSLLPNAFAQSVEGKLASLDKFSSSERQQRILDGARSEGEAVIYANMDVAAMNPLAQGFMKKYPAVKATSVHFSGASIITRLDAENRAGKAVSDVVLSGQLGVLALIDKKIAARYRSPEREFYRDGLRDNDGLWTAYMTNVMVTAYNTRLVRKDDAPHHVMDLVKPVWKNKLTMDSQSYVWFGTMLQYLGVFAEVLKHRAEQIGRAHV